MARSERCEEKAWTSRRCSRIASIRSPNDTEALLDRLLAPAPVDGERARPARLLDAMRYASLGGGKRFRPFLVVECAALFGVAREHALMAAARARMRALLFAGARRPAGHGRRRSAARPADRAQGIRRGDRHPRRRRAADPRVRHPRRARDPSRCRRCGSSSSRRWRARRVSAAWSAARCSISRPKAASTARRRRSASRRSRRCRR